MSSSSVTPDFREQYRRFYSLLKNELQFSQNVKHDIVVVLFKTLIKITIQQLKASVPNPENYEKILNEFKKWLKSFERFPFLLEDICRLHQMFLQSDMSILPENMQKLLYPGNPSKSLLFISKNSYLFLQSLPQYEYIRHLFPKTIEYLQDIPRHEMYCEGVSIIHDCNITAVVKCNTENEYTVGVHKDTLSFYSRLDELAYKRHRQEIAAISRADPETGVKLQGVKWAPDVKRDPIDMYYQPTPEQDIAIRHWFSNMYVNKKNLERNQAKMDVLSLNYVDVTCDITKVEVGCFFGVAVFGYRSGKIRVLILDQMKKRGGYEWTKRNLEKKETKIRKPGANAQEGEGMIEETMEEEKQNEDGETLQWQDDLFDIARDKFEEEITNKSIFNEKSEMVSGFPGISLVGHEGMITCLALSFDENHLVSGSTDTTIRFWNIPLGLCLSVYRSHLKTVWDVCLAQRGPYFLSGGDEGLAVLWASNNTKPLCAIAHKCAVTHVALTHNLKYGVSYSIDRTIFVWELKSSASPARIIFTDFFVSSMALKMNGDILYIGYENGHAQTWDIAKMKKLRTIKANLIARQPVKSPVIRISLSADEKTLLLITGTTFGLYNTSDLESIPSHDALELSQGEPVDYFTRNEVKPNRFYKFEGEDRAKMSLDSMRILGGVMHVMNFAVLVTSSNRWQQPRPKQVKLKQISSF